MSRHSAPGFSAPRPALVWAASWLGLKAGSRFGLSSQSKRNAAQKVLELLQLTLTRCYLLLLRAGAARCCCCVSLAKIQRPAESLSPFQLGGAPGLRPSSLPTTCIAGIEGCEITIAHSVLACANIDLRFAHLGLGCRQDLLPLLSQSPRSPHELLNLQPRSKQGNLKPSSTARCYCPSPPSVCAAAAANHQISPAVGCTHQPFAIHTSM